MDGGGSYTFSWNDQMGLDLGWHCRIINRARNQRSKFTVHNNKTELTSLHITNHYFLLITIRTSIDSSSTYCTKSSASSRPSYCGISSHWLCWVRMNRWLESVKPLSLFYHYSCLEDKVQPNHSSVFKICCFQVCSSLTSRLLLVSDSILTWGYC